MFSWGTTPNAYSGDWCVMHNDMFVCKVCRYTQDISTSALTSNLRVH